MITNYFKKAIMTEDEVMAYILKHRTMPPQNQLPESLRTKKPVKKVEPVVEEGFIIPEV